MGAHSPHPPAALGAGARSACQRPAAPSTHTASAQLHLAAQLLCNVARLQTPPPIDCVLCLCMHARAPRAPQPTEQPPAPSVRATLGTRPSSTPAPAPRTAGGARSVRAMPKHRPCTTPQNRRRSSLCARNAQAPCTYLYRLLERRQPQHHVRLALADVRHRAPCGSLQLDGVGAADDAARGLHVLRTQGVQARVHRRMHARADACVPAHTCVPLRSPRPLMTPPLQQPPRNTQPGSCRGKEVGTQLWEGRESRRGR